MLIELEVWLGSGLTIKFGEGSLMAHLPALGGLVQLCRQEVASNLQRLSYTPHTPHSHFLQWVQVPDGSGEDSRGSQDVALRL